MPAAPPPPGPRPAWYRRLPPSLQRVAAASDRVTSLPLRAGPGLRESVAALQDVLLSEQVDRGARRWRSRSPTTCAAALGVADGCAFACRASGRTTRAASCTASTCPRTAAGATAITLWMRTAKRGQVVAYRTFLRTLLHELCHHLDYTYLHLRDSLHTQGFYQRESSLFAALGAASPGSARVRPVAHDAVRAGRASALEQDRSWSPRNVRDPGHRALQRQRRPREVLGQARCIA